MAHTTTPGPVDPAQQGKPRILGLQGQLQPSGPGAVALNSSSELRVAWGLCMNRKRADFYLHSDSGMAGVCSLFKCTKLWAFYPPTLTHGSRLISQAPPTHYWKNFKALWSTHLWCLPAKMRTFWSTRLVSYGVHTTRWAPTGDSLYNVHPKL